MWFRWIFFGTALLGLFLNSFFSDLVALHVQLPLHFPGLAENLAFWVAALFLKSLGLWILLRPAKNSFSLWNCFLATLAGVLWGALAGWPVGIASTCFLLYGEAEADLDKLLAGVFANEFLHFALFVGLANLGAFSVSADIPEIRALPVCSALALAGLAYFVFLDGPLGDLLRRLFVGSSGGKIPRKQGRPLKPISIRCAPWDTWSCRPPLLRFFPS